MFDWFSPRRARQGGALVSPSSAALLLVAVDLATRLGLRLIAPEDQADLIFGLFVYGVVLLTAVICGLVWARRYLLARVWAYLLAAAVPAAIVICLFGPWVSGEEFGGGGAKVIVLRMLLTFGVLAAGGVIGVLSTVMLGQDLTSRVWKAQAERVLIKRRRAQP